MTPIMNLRTRWKQNDENFLESFRNQFEKSVRILDAIQAAFVVLVEMIGEAKTPVA